MLSALKSSGFIPIALEYARKAESNWPFLKLSLPRSRSISAWSSTGLDAPDRIVALDVLSLGFETDPTASGGRYAIEAGVSLAGAAPAAVVLKTSLDSDSAVSCDSDAVNDTNNAGYINFVAIAGIAAARPNLLGRTVPTCYTSGACGQQRFPLTAEGATHPASARLIY